MQSKPICDYIIFGANIRYLNDAITSFEDYAYPVHGERCVLPIIDLIFESLNEFNLPVTQRAGATKRLKKFSDKLAQTDPDHNLTADEASDLKEIMDDLKKTLLAEAEGNIAFIVTDKRLDVNKVLYDMPALMAPNVFDALPDIAQYDFGEAGKCIAFGRPTAAAFHLLRGTEAVLRYFYCSFVKRNRVKGMLWGPMTEHLKKRRNKPPDVLLNNLDNIRRSFRNPTQHPEKIYDIEEVQDLFGLCIDVVNRMIRLL